ncbi:hypothetical protein K5V21_17265 [Clostridium sardiniense]|uniref:Uncharacterized protein n=1 Tax=Clostridium sardiniense TaxID=29369 RepID=A0ABS7L272_CLOSR|nr:hypothetical protein [Clostridium sardiniense]MBY0757183.1 hypothetical protein [Clostridium sardiniense]MDQ0461641.1 hypothetical protein [Clostridium sardiniense]
MIELKKELNNKAIENREERVSMGQFIEIGFSRAGLGIDYKGDKIDESDSILNDVKGEK